MLRSTLVICAVVLSAQTHAQTLPPASVGSKPTFLRGSIGEKLGVPTLKTEPQSNVRTKFVKPNRSQPIIKLNKGENLSNWLDSLGTGTNERGEQGLQPLLKVQDLRTDQVQSGAAIPLETLQSKITTPGTLQKLQIPQPIPVDLKELGLTEPTNPIDIFSLYRGNQFKGIVTRPPNQSVAQFYSTLSQNGTHAIPKIAKFGQKVVSSLNQLILATLFEICSAPFRPKEVNLHFKGGLGLVISFEGGVSAKIDLDSSCTALTAIQKRDVARADP